MAHILNVKPMEECRRCGKSMQKDDGVELTQHYGNKLYFCLTCWVNTVSKEIEDQQKWLLNRK